MRLGLRSTAPVWPLLMVMLLTACAEEAATPVDDGKVSIESYPGDDRRASPDALVAAAAIDPAPLHQVFAFEHFRARAGDGNTLTAPFDVQQLLAGLAPGASGETLQAIATAGGWASLGNSVGAETLAGISLWEQRVDDLDAVERQRWLWGQAGYRFDRDYLRAQAELFGPELAGLDFRGDFPSARAAVEGALDDRLTLEDISDRSRQVLAQTTRLQAAWADGLTIEPFEGRFGEHEEQRLVPMLRISGGLSVAEGEDYRAVAVPLAEAGLSLVVITPARDAFDAVRGRLGAEFWRRLGEDLTPLQTTLKLPVFSLNRILVDNPDLGIAQREEAADFSPLNGAGFLYLEPLRQSVELQVDEAGLNAATATTAVHTATWDEPPDLFYPPSPITGGIIITGPGIPPPTRCFYPPDQHPFFFAVYARDTATLLHIGQVKILDGQLVAADWIEPYGTACGNSPWVEVYYCKGLLQCGGPNNGIDLWDIRQILADAEIRWDSYSVGSDCGMYSQACDGSEGVFSIVTIQESQLAAAEELGFLPMSSLTLEVYRYKGSRQCAFGSGMPAMYMAQTLMDAGIDVREYREGMDGKEYLQVCDGPDGVINIFAIPASDLEKAEVLGFAPLSRLQSE